MRLSPVLILIPSLAQAEKCPIDRLIFLSIETGARFSVERVEEALDDRGHGDTAFYGRFAASGASEIPAVAVYSVFDALPCCVWYSYGEGEAFTQAYSTLPEFTFRVVQDPPVVDFDEIIIDQENKPPWPEDKGPLNGDEYVIVGCRE